MTKEYRIEDLKVGEIVFVYAEITRGFSSIGGYYRSILVDRITPKKTKLVSHNGIEYDRYTRFYKELDDEMKAVNHKTINKTNIYDCYVKLEKMLRKDWQKMKNGDLELLGSECKQLKRDVEDITNRLENKTY